jgi:hypothetical protein
MLVVVGLKGAGAVGLWWWTDGGEGREEATVRVLVGNAGANGLCAPPDGVDGGAGRQHRAAVQQDGPPAGKASWDMFVTCDSMIQ